MMHPYPSKLEQVSSVESKSVSFEGWRAHLYCSFNILINDYCRARRDYLNSLIYIIIYWCTGACNYHWTDVLDSCIYGLMMHLLCLLYWQCLAQYHGWVRVHPPCGRPLPDCRRGTHRPDPGLPIPPLLHHPRPALRAARPQSIHRRYGATHNIPRVSFILFAPCLNDVYWSHVYSE